MKRIRHYHEGELPPWDPHTARIYREEAYLYPTGEPYLLPLVILKTRPCRWLETDGGCTTCNYQFVADFAERVDDEAILRQVDWALARPGRRGGTPTCTWLPAARSWTSGRSVMTCS